MTNQMFFDRAYSVKIEPWVSLKEVYNRIFEEGFCHDNHLVVKMTGISLGASKTWVKETFNFVGRQIQISDDIRVCFPLQDDGTLYARLRNNTVKIQYDHGVEVFKGFVYNLYGSGNIFKNVHNPNFQIGTILLSKTYFCDNLLKLSSNDVRWYHKTMLKWKGLRMGVVGVVDFSSSTFLKKQLSLGYLFRRLGFYALASSNLNQSVSQFATNKFKCTLVYHQRDNQRTVGLETLYNGNIKALQEVSGLLQYRYKGRNRMKVKLNNKSAFSFMWETKWNDHLTSSIGFHFRLFKQVKGEKMDKSRVGLKMQINV